MANAYRYKYAGDKSGASPHPRVSVSPRPRVTASPHLPVSPSPRRFILLLTAGCLLLTAACRQDMQDQPKMKPYRSTAFFSNGLSSRPPVTGTVPRGYLRADRAFFTGKKNSSGATSGPSAAAPGAAASPGTSGQQPGSPQATYPDDIDEFPLPITTEIVARGRERFEIFCAACHGLTGNGDGMIVRRGYRRAASFHTDVLRQAPVGHFFDAITNGWGAMPAYAPQIPPQDRWAIVAYIRALQLSNTQTQQGTATTPAAPSPAATPAGGGHQ